MSRADGRTGLPALPASLQRRRSAGWERRLRGFVAMAVLLLVGGCSTMPSSGPVQSENQPGINQNDKSRVQVFPQPPYPNEQPEQIVDGFLEALASSDLSTDPTARAYLTPAASATWQPSNGAMIVEALTQPTRTSGGEAAGGVGLDLPVTPVAYLDPTFGSYFPAGNVQPQTVHFTVVRSAGQWRIADPPSRLIVSELDFQRVFQPVDLYYVSALGSDHPTLVPDRIYLRDDSGTPKAALRALLAGPSDWLAPGVDPVPVAAARRLSVGDVSEISGVGRVVIDGPLDALDNTVRTQLAAEIYWTLSRLSGVSLGLLSLVDGSGRTVVGVDQTAMAHYDPDALPVDPSAYLLQPQTKGVPGSVLVRGTDSPHVVPGGLGDGSFLMRSAAVAPSGDCAAGVSTDGKTLVVGSFQSGSHTVRAFVGTNLSTPSWDGAGDLWVVDRTPTGAVVHEIVGAAKAAAAGFVPASAVRSVAVDAQPFAPPGAPSPTGPLTITALRLATDGTRVVATATAGTNQQIVLTGVVAPDATVAGSVQITHLRMIVPQLSSVADAVWDGPRRLALLGPEPYLVDVDGASLTSVSSPPTAPVFIAAAQPDLPNPLPLLVTDANGVLYEYQPGTSTVWTRLGQAQVPIYPG